MTGKLRIFAIAAIVMAFAPFSGANAITSNERSYQFSESGIELFNKGEFRAAIIQLKNAIQQNPRNPAARMLLGRAYLRIGEAQLAERELLSARRTGAHPNLILVPLGQTYLLQRKYRKVLDDIKPGHRGKRLEASVLDLRGRAQLALGDLKNAEATFAAGARLDPRATFPLLGQARVNMMKRQLDAAEVLVDKALELDAKSADAWYEKGEVRRARQNHAVALSSYGKAIDYRSNHIPARLSRAAILAQLRRDEEALEDIEFVREFSPNDTQAAYLQSVLLTRLGRVNEAQAILTEAENFLKKRPPEFVRNHPPSLLLLGVIGYARKNYEDAYQYLNRYVALNPDHPEARKLLAAMLMRKGDDWSAIEMLKPALGLAPNDYELLTLLGRAYMQVKQFSLATEMLEKATALAPNEARIHTLLGLSRIAGGEAPQGVDDLEKALSLTPDGSRPDVLLGLFYLRNKKYDEALKIAGSIEKSNPSNPFAYNLAGAAQLRKGNREEARRRFNTAIQVDPKYTPAYFNLAEIDIADGNTDAAKDRYYEILRIQPKNIKAMRALADISVSQNNLDEAIRLLSEIGVLEPNATVHQARLVDLYLRQKRLDAALNLARSLEIVHPTDLVVLTALGRALLAAEKYAEAATKYRRIAEITRQEPEPLRRVALLQEKARDFDGARETLRKAIALDQNYLPVQIALIRLETRDKNFDGALELANALRQAHPDFRTADLIAGDLFMRVNQYDKAAEAFTTALAKAEKFDAIQRLYDARYQAGHAEEAFALITDWVTKHPDDLFAKRLLASAYRRAGQLNKAIVLNESLLSRIPDDPVLLNNLAGLYQLTGDKRALSYAEKAYNLAPEHPVMLDTFGWILVTTGDADRGLTLLRQAFTRAADNPEIRYHLAVALNSTGRTKEAREELEKALETGKAFEGVSEARALLRKLRDG